MAQSALGSLGPLLGYVSNRRNARDLKDYRDQTLADRDESLRLMRNADERAQEEADATDLARFGAQYFNTVASGFDDLEPNANGGMKVGAESMQSALKNNPDLTRRLLTQSGAFKTLLDPSVKGYDDITGIQAIPQEDGTVGYAVTVKNADTEGPLAVGGSTDDAAPIATISEADMLRVFNQGLTSAYANGGSTSVSMQTRLLNNAMVGRGPMEQATGAVLGQSAGAMSQAGIPEGVDAARAAGLDLGEASYDELAQILINDGNMTREEVEAKFPRAQTEPQASTNEGGDRTGLSGSLTKLLDDRDAYRERADRPEPESSLLNSQMPSGVPERAAKLGEKKDQEIAEYGSTLAADIERLEARGPNNPRGRMAHDQKLARMRADFEYLNPTAVTPDSKLDGIDAPDQTITLGNMRELIVDRGWTPTEQQKEQVASQLQAANVTSASQIAQALGGREATLAYAVLAGSDPRLNADQKVKLINQLVNFGQTGDTEYGIEDQFRDARGNADLSLRLANYQRSISKDVSALGVEVAKGIRAQIELVGDRDVSWSDETFLSGVAEMRAQYEMADPGSPEQLQYGRGMREMLGLTMKKYVEEERPGLIQRVENIFRRDPDNQVSIDNMFDRIVVNEANDTFGFTDTVDGAGIEEGEFPLSILRQVVGPQYSRFVRDAANTRPQVEM